MKNNVVLLGMRGSGKSTIGKLVAEILEMNFFDTDVKIEKKIKMSISDFVKENGWEAFREVETKVCEKISQEKNAVIATGGGVVLNNKNIENLQKNGILFFLETPMEVLTERIEVQNANHRPAFTKKKLKDELQEIWKNRKEKYFFAANSVINGNQKMEKVVKEIIKKRKKVFSSKKTS